MLSRYVRSHSRRLTKSYKIKIIIKKSDMKNIEIGIERKEGKIAERYVIV